MISCTSNYDNHLRKIKTKIVDTVFNILNFSLLFDIYVSFFFLFFIFHSSFLFLIFYLTFYNYIFLFHFTFLVNSSLSFYSLLLLLIRYRTEDCFKINKAAWPHWRYCSRLDKGEIIWDTIHLRDTNYTILYFNIHPQNL